MSSFSEERWEILEKIGAYAAGELEDEEARETGRLLLERPDLRSLAESYTQMFAMLSALGQESPEPPQTVINYAVRRAYLSAFLRQADEILRGLADDYLGALVYYLGLRQVRE
jgi:anti-sigma-K factor RskA